MKKILVITDQFPNSVQPVRGIFTLQWLMNLSKICDIKAIIPLSWIDFKIKSKHKRLKEKLPLDENYSGIEVLRPLYFYTPKFARSFYGFFYFSSILPLALKIKKSFRYEAIYAVTAYPDGFAAVLLGWLTGTPVIVHAIGTDINVYTQSFLRRKLILWSLKKCFKIISVSEALKKRMIEIGVPSEKIDVIYNGVDRSVFSLKKNCTDLTYQQKLILYVGNLKKEKGLSELIEAYRSVKNDKLSLVIIGDGLYKKELLRQIEKYDLKQVKLMGSQPPSVVADWMNRATVLCLPSYNEGVPNVVLESIACGLPVVATDVGGIPEIIVSEEYGLMLKRRDSRQLAERLTEALNKKWDKKKIAEYSKKFSWEPFNMFFFRELSLNSNC